MRAQGNGLPAIKVCSGLAEMRSNIHGKKRLSIKYLANLTRLPLSASLSSVDQPRKLPKRDKVRAKLSSVLFEPFSKWCSMNGTNNLKKLSLSETSSFISRIRVTGFRSPSVVCEGSKCWTMPSESLVAGIAIFSQQGFECRNDDPF